MLLNRLHSYDDTGRRFWMNAPNHSCRKNAHHHRKQPISLSKPFSAILIITHLESYRALTNTAKLARMRHNPLRTPHKLVERGILSSNTANSLQTPHNRAERRITRPKSPHNQQKKESYHLGFPSQLNST